MVRWPPRSTVSSEGRRDPPPHRRFISRRTAPPTCDTDPSPTTTNAASLSRARPTRRSATCRVSVGALSSTTSVNAPLRSSTSAHQAPRAGSRGRTIRRKSQSREAQPAGSRVRDASMQATPCPRPRAAPTSPRTSVPVPAPSGPISSVSRPRGSPPPRASSSSRNPVGRASAATGGGAMTRSSWERSWASCIQPFVIKEVMDMCLLPNKYRS